MGGLELAGYKLGAIGSDLASGVYGGLSYMASGFNKADPGLVRARWGVLMSNAKLQYGGNPEQGALYRLAGLMLNDKGGTLGYIDFKEGRDWIVNKYNSLSDDDKLQVQYLAASIQNFDDTRIFGNDGNVVMPNSIDWNNYHKAGLNFVPKENYKALLHKGEMVLNARQAERYRRSMGIDRYGNGYGGSLSPSDSDYVGPHHSGYAGHNGIDLYFGDIGTPVGSAVSGRVLDSNDIPVNWNDGKKFHGKDTSGIAYSSYGRYVKVLGDDGHTYIYAHLNERAVNTGDIVSAGTLLGYSGTTGNSSGPHLHFEVKGAGTGEANHAKYYTPYVRNVIGTASSSLANATLVGVDRIDSDSKVSVNSRRFIPKIFSENMGAGGDSASRITNSVDGGFRNLISYLESIRSEQETQRAMIEAFSNSRLS
jgi:murein DD-endopeptidase MepM/ murein hydrolase activator NlpD